MLQVAKRLGVGVYVDAEQTYLQPAIRHLVVHHLMPSFNRESPTILNTIQCYLKVRATARAGRLSVVAFRAAHAAENATK